MLVRNTIILLLALFGGCSQRPPAGSSSTPLSIKVGYELNGIFFLKGNKLNQSGLAVIYYKQHYWDKANLAIGYEDSKGLTLSFKSEKLIVESGTVFFAKPNELLIKRINIKWSADQKILESRIRDYFKLNKITPLNCDHVFDGN